MAQIKKRLRVVIVGGGAGGLELAARLSRSLIKNKKISLTLIDNKLKHIWKPLLHEVAAGTLHSIADEVDYITYAYQHGFHFFYGSIHHINRTEKVIYIKSPLTPTLQTLDYDVLIFTIGSLTNDFNIPGVKEHCLFLDNLKQAENFNHELLNSIIKLQQNIDTHKTLEIAIIGAGATGVELAAELHFALSQVQEYKNIHSDFLHFKIKIIESADRILPALESRLGKLVSKHLRQLHIEILVHQRVTKITKTGIETSEGKFIPSDLTIWAAGVKADTVLNHLDGLEVNRINQLVVNEDLTTTKDPSIFAFGDCASCPQLDSEGKIFYVPPRAQAAHQQAKLLVTSLKCYLKKSPLPKYIYKDHGSLISISGYNVVGKLMSRIAKSILFEGLFARLTYWSLYKKHQLILWGWWRVLSLSIANILTKKIRPRLKLH